MGDLTRRAIAISSTSLLALTMTAAPAAAQDAAARAEVKAERMFNKAVSK